MKLKKYIGKSINGFTILDTYPVQLPSGKTTRRVLVCCDDCGRKFERNSGIDFNHIKCKCKCTDYNVKHREKILFNGIEYSKTELCNEYGISVNKFNYRIKQGMTVQQAVQNVFWCKCEQCGRVFESEKAGKKYCSKTCVHRHHNGKPAKLIQPYFAKCIICENLFCTTDARAKTCSAKCRTARDRIERSGRYNEIKARGEFDSTVTLANVFEKYGGICCGCGKKLSFDCNVNSTDYPSIDHITPISKGGSHTWDNVQLLCRRCNSKKGAKIA